METPPGPSSFVNPKFISKNWKKIQHRFNKALSENKLTFNKLKKTKAQSKSLPSLSAKEPAPIFRFGSASSVFPFGCSNELLSYEKDIFCGNESEDDSDQFSSTNEDEDEENFLQQCSANKLIELGRFLKRREKKRMKKTLKRKTNLLPDCAEKRKKYQCKKLGDLKMKLFSDSD